MLFPSKNFNQAADFWKGNLTLFAYCFEVTHNISIIFIELLKISYEMKALNLCFFRVCGHYFVFVP